MRPIVHIVDDDPSFRSSLARLIEASGYQVSMWESGDEILAGRIDGAPCCILLDLQMPGLSGAELQQRLAERTPLVPIVFLTGHGDVEASVRAIKAGAEDFLQKPASAAAVIGAIERALALYEKRHAETTRAQSLHLRVANLTPRETEVFGLMVRGKRNKQIAHELGTSERTVKAHRHGVMEKLGVNSLAEAVSIAERLGLLDAG